MMFVLHVFPYGGLCLDCHHADASVAEVPRDGKIQMRKKWSSRQHTEAEVYLVVLFEWKDRNLGSSGQAISSKVREKEVAKFPNDCAKIGASVHE